MLFLLIINYFSVVGAQWVALLLHSKEVLGLEGHPGSFLCGVLFECYFHIYVGFSIMLYGTIQSHASEKK